MDTNLIVFLQKDAVQLLKKINPETTNLFGKMNPMQMMEHLAEWISISSGRRSASMMVPLSCYTCIAYTHPRVWGITKCPWSRSHQL
jgi:hypothetical protein